MRKPMRSISRAIIPACAFASLGPSGVVVNGGKPNQQVTQTRFNNWFQQSGQWFPGQIVRLGSGQQVLGFQAQRAGVSGQAAPSVFQL